MPVAALEAAGELRGYARLCSPEEELRRGRLVFERDRRSFLAAHGLVRLALSWCRPDVDPSSWRFRPGPFGRPELVGQPSETGLDANLSHSAGWVACIVTRGLRCGIDVEKVGGEADHADLATWALTPLEADELRETSPALRPRRFIECWTRKEAVAKAVGLGVHLPFDQVGFRTNGSGIELSTAPESVALAGGQRWTIEQWSADEDHVVALAVIGDTRPLRIVRHSAPPT